MLNVERHELAPLKRSGIPEQQLIQAVTATERRKIGPVVSVDPLGRRRMIRGC